MCVDEIGLCAQNMLTILGSIVDTTIGKAYWSLKERESSLWSFITFVFLETLILELGMAVCRFLNC
jgi:hypothetical protein